MAVGNYNAGRSRHDQLARARTVEAHHIEAIPEGEREETRQLLVRKGLEGEALESALASITRNRRLWIDFMVSEEWGLRIHEPPPLTEAIVTFLAFAGFGSVPLLPYLVSGIDSANAFSFSIGLTLIAFTAVGVLKGVATESSILRAATLTLVTGAGASLMAFGVGVLLRTWLS
jgi:VIT1/CCC1 family predicted Fe2+/Mn2+ transporter